MKKIVSLILVLVMAFACVGCQSAAKEKQTTVTVWAVPLIVDFETLFNETFLPKFEEMYPNIKVELEMQTWEGVNDKLQMALQSGNYPDVFLDGTARCAALPSLGVLEPVDDVIAELGGWYDSVSNIGVIDGVHYLVPETAMCSCMVSVNVDLAKELGVYDMLPEDRMSWDIHDMYAFVEAASVAGKEKDIQGIFLYAGSATSDDVLYSLLMSNGGSIIDKETMTCVANSPECVEVVEVLGNIVKNGYAVPGATMLTGGDSHPMFLSQKFVLTLNAASTYLIPQFQQMVEEGYLDKVPEVRIYGVPHADDVDMESACWGANTFAIFKNEDAAKVEAAKTVVKAFAGMDEITGKIWSDNADYPPARETKAVFKSDNEDLKAEVVFAQELTSQYANSDFGIMEAYWPEVRNCFYPELQAVYNGDKTAQEAMDSFVENVNTVLEKYR